MPIELTDEQIERLLTCAKRITNPGTRWKTQQGVRQRNFKVKADSGEDMHLFLRQNTKIPENFSCGLRCIMPNGDSVMLARYNGSNHPHRNPIERTEFSFQCHIHKATERYIAIGRKSEHYAEPTTRYTNLDGAFLALTADCNISGMPGNDDESPIEDLFP